MAVEFYKVLDISSPMELNSIRLVEAQGNQLCLIRLADSYRACEPKCPHAGAPLVHGKCSPEGKLTCPFHRYQYDLTTGRGLPQQGDFIELYPTEMREDGVYVGLTKKWWKLL